MRASALLFVVVLLSSSSSWAQGSLGALCSDASPCAEGLTCRDGFCLRLSPEPPAASAPESEAPAKSPAAPEAEPGAKPDGKPEAEPEAKPQPGPEAPAVEVPGSSTTTGEPVEEPLDEPLDSDAADAAGDDAGAVEGAAEGAAPDAAAAPEEPAPAPGDPPAAPPSSKEPALTPAQAKERASDAGAAVWAGAGGRALAVPTLACGSCLLGAGIATVLGAQAFVGLGNSGVFNGPDAAGEARLGGNVATGIGVIMAALGLPFLVVGEGAVVYSAFTDWGPCASGIALDDVALIALGVARAAVWGLGAQVGACGVGLVASGVWAMAVSSVGGSMDLAGPALVLFDGISATGAGVASLGVIPLGVGCVMGVLAAGLDLGTILRAGALEEEADARLEEQTVRAPTITPQYASAPARTASAQADMLY